LPEVPSLLGRVRERFKYHAFLNNPTRLRPSIHPLYTGYSLRQYSLYGVIFYCSSDLAVPFHDERNRGIEAVPSLLEELSRRGARVRRIDPCSLTAERRFAEYSKATIPAVHKKYEVKRIFGTNRHSACWFGVQVPALIVKRHAEDLVGDTYPHREAPNFVITIHDFLTNALANFTSATGAE